MSNIDVIHVDGGPRRGLYFRTKSDRDRFISRIPQSASVRLGGQGELLFGALGDPASTPLYVASADDWAWLQIGLMVRPGKEPSHDR